MHVKGTAVHRFSPISPFEVVARLCGKYGDRTACTESVDQWVEKHKTDRQPDSSPSPKLDLHCLLVQSGARYLGL